MSTVPACLLSTLPVIQPPHLDGDPALATEILPGPPSLESIRQISKRNEPRKFPIPSYLPLSDPGTTYTSPYSSLAGGMAAMALDGAGSRRKRARLDKGISNRSQRASARHLAGSSVLDDQIMALETEATSSHPGMEDGATLNEEDRSTSLSRSTSAPLSGETQAQFISASDSRIANGKGKGKEKDITERVAQVRVKEEPVALQLSDMTSALLNEDHCSSCSSVGALVYCDGCPRAFHLWCLDPPMDPSDFPEGEGSWFCPACKVDRGPPPRAPHSFLSPLIQQLQNTIPTEFRLPEDIRTFFRDVGTGPGGVYVDISSVKATRIGRHGLGEERDPYRLKDGKGSPVICFRCGKSALPDETGTEHSTRRRAASRSQQWKSMISCDFCPLHWHVDCLDPPMTSLPPMNRKWKCPNHASRSTPKLRTPRTAGPPIDITEPRQRNNGNIEVINSEEQDRSEEGMSVDEVLINGRRYRVPERIIVVDFWNKVRQQEVKSSQTLSTASSPLTSLSSLEDSGDHPPALRLGGRLADLETLRIAELLCQLQSTNAVRSVQEPTSEKNTPKEGRDSTRSGQRGARRRSLHANKTETLSEVQRRTSRCSSVSASASKYSFTNVGVNGACPPNSKKVEQNAIALNGIHNTGSEGLGERPVTNVPGEVADRRPSTAPLKIRIPGRLLQKQTSNGSVSSVGPTPSSSNSRLRLRPRRSLRQTSMYRSESIDTDMLDALE